MNEYFAASGLNSGASGQAQLAQNNVYQGNIGTLEKEKTTALNEVENQRTQLSTQYQNAIAEAISQNNLQKAQALYNEAVRVDESIVNTAMAQAQMNYQAALNSYNMKKDMADTLAGYGNFSGYGGLGYTPSQTQSMTDAYNAALAGKGSGDKKAVSWDGAVKYMESGGDPEDYIKASYREMGFSSQTEALAAFNVYLHGQEQQQPEEGSKGGRRQGQTLLHRQALREEDSNYSAARQAVEQSIGAGKYEEAKAMLSNAFNEGAITSSEYLHIMSRIIDAEERR